MGLYSKSKYKNKDLGKIQDPNLNFKIILLDFFRKVNPWRDLI